MDYKNIEMQCNSCENDIDVCNKYALFEGLAWHGDCFVCSICDKNLNNILFMLNNRNELLCNECYDDKFGVLCDACHTIVKLGEEKCKFGELLWHVKCFQCQNCHIELDPNSFWAHEKSNYCKTCFGDLFTKICEKCEEKIWKNRLKFRNKYLHTECFVCNICKIELSDKRFLYKNEELLCENCYSKNLCKKCVRCNDSITGLDGEEMITSNNENWHKKCFYCNTCNQSLVGLSFVGKESEIFCPGCSK